MYNFLSFGRRRSQKDDDICLTCRPNYLLTAVSLVAIPPDVSIITYCAASFLSGCPRMTSKKPIVRARGEEESQNCFSVLGEITGNL